MNVKLINSTPDPEGVIAKIAGICRDKEAKNPRKLVEHLYRCGHHSVFEHVYFTWLIEDISRACSHQLVRHRHCAFTQRSQKHCSEEGFEYVTPPFVKQNEVLDSYFCGQMLDINFGYSQLMHETVPSEDARYVLPNACVTELYMSCNLRELIHIANERLCSRAQWEIRGLVQKMCESVDESIRWMLVPKCKSGRIVCNEPCEMQAAEPVKTTEDEHSHKHDEGKPRLALVPPALIEAVGEIRTYGTDKYGDPDGWRKVAPERYRDAMMRHLCEYLRDFSGSDQESGLPHLWHAACNAAFLIEMDKEGIQ